MQFLMMQSLPSLLPLHRDAAIFVRFDSERIDVMRACITGPPGTSYAQGCFMFDIFFPDAYPNVSPLVDFITTGNGRVRFNPNLYADGKVYHGTLISLHLAVASCCCILLLHLAVVFCYSWCVLLHTHTPLSEYYIDASDSNRCQGVFEFVRYVARRQRFREVEPPRQWAPIIKSVSGFFLHHKNKIK